MFVTCPKCQSVFRPGPVVVCPSCGTQLNIRQKGQTETRDEFFAGLGVDTRGTPADERTDIPNTEVTETYAVPVPVAQRDAGRFADALLDISPRLYMTPALVVINLLVFVVTAVYCRNFWMFPRLELIELGANDGSLTLGGEWWRLLTCTFLHGGLLHVACNMWVLWSLGQLVERMLGNVGFLLLYILSGLAGSLASIYWDPSRVSVGASGAVFGVFGALMGFLLLRRDSVPKHVLSRLRNSCLTFLALNLVLGLSIPIIDNAAHMGGLAAGFLFGLLLSQPLADSTRISRTRRNLAMLGLGTIAVAVAIHLAPDPPGKPSATTNLSSEWERLATEVQRSLHIYDDITRPYAQRELDASEMKQIADGVQQRIIPILQSARQRIDQLADANPNQQAQLASLQQQAATVEQIWQTMADSLRENDIQRFQQARIELSQSLAALKNLLSAKAE